MADEKDNRNLPAHGGEFARTFTKEGEAHGAGIVAVPFIVIAFMLFILLGLLMLAAGGISLILGKPAKFDFKYSLNKSRGMFGNRNFANPPGDDNVIDVEATEINDKEIDGR